MKHPFLLALPLAFAALLSSAPARADVAPFCSDFDKDTDCAQADVGKECPGGGTCRELFCESSAGGGDKAFKCKTCAFVEVEDTAKVCEPGPSAFGKECGDGGTCTKLPSWCPNPGTIACAKDAGGAAGAGGSGQAGAGGEAGSGTAGSGTAGSGTAGSGTAGSGTAGSGTAGSGTAGSGTAGSTAAPAPAEAEDSSCAVSGAGRHGALAGLMLALGAAALLVERRRRLAGCSWGVRRPG
jgi:hypothetical protein